MGAIVAWATARGALAQVRHVAPTPPGRARGLVAEVYRQVQGDFGMFAPPVCLHAPAPEVLAAVWLTLRETLLASGATSRAAKEAVAAAVSHANACPYCVDIHTTALRGLTRARHAVAIADGRPEAVRDPALRAVAAWAHDSGTRAGAARRRLAVSAEEAAELVGVAVVFHYLNRMVNVFLDRSPIPPDMPAPVRSGIQQVLGWLMAPTTRRTRVPGRALGLLPDAPTPAELSWAATTPRLAATFGQAAAALDAAGARSVPSAVRSLVLDRLAAWDGTPPGASRAWVDDAVAELDRQHRPAGRLALLTALASYQVAPSTVDDVRHQGTDDATLVELAAWASFAAASRVGAWMRTG
jgi:AhpD family alkylhydroperoxidase